MVRRYTHNTSHHRGSGLLNTITNTASRVINKTIDLLPVEIHLPGYQYCGPGTNLNIRLARGDPGINKLDSYCKEHDIAYSQNSDNKYRAEADRKLAEQAWERVRASDSSIGERAASWAITNIMKAKSKLGGGRVIKKKRNCSCENKLLVKSKNKTCKTGQGLYLKPYSKGSGLKKKKQHTHQK